MHSEIGLLDGKVVISGYNKTYGDLVVGFRDGTEMKWEFVDGIPAGGQVVGATDGPRGGIKEGGDDVGHHTSIAVGQDRSLHISYHDVTNGALKYAHRKPSGEWSHHTVDKNGKLVGRFTSITLANGSPSIAYFVADDGSGKTELRVAQGKTGAPAAETDWTIMKADSADRPACKGQCDSKKKEICVEDAGAFSCQVPTGDAKSCKPKACKDGEEACVNGRCLKITADDANPPLPVGVGLFPSIAVLPSGGLVVAYYDNNEKNLKLASQPSPGSPFQAVVVRDKGDVGQFASVAVDAQGGIHISYINADDADLYYVTLDAQFKVTSEELVDDGFSSAGGGEDRLLADCSLVIHQGAPRIVYQDASSQALKVAVRLGAKNWKKSKLVGDGSAEKGAFGFFADQVLGGDTSYISNYKYDLRNKKSALDIRTWKP